MLKKKIVLKKIKYNENIDISEKAEDFILKISNYSIRVLINYLEKLKPGKDNELQLTDAIRDFIKEGNFNIDAILSNSKIFHAGTKKENNRILSNGGRVIACTGYGESLEDALKNSYKCL